MRRDGGAAKKRAVSGASTAMIPARLGWRSDVTAKSIETCGGALFQKNRLKSV